MEKQIDKEVSNVYIVSTIKLNEKTKDDLLKEYEIYKIKYSGWKEKTYDSFYKFQEDWNWHKYNLEIEDNSYFLDLEKAKTCVENNFCDINDGGLYNYVLIKKVCLEKAYAKTFSIEGYLFEFNSDSRTYKEVPIDLNEETQYIAEKLMFY